MDETDVRTQKRQWRPLSELFVMSFLYPPNPWCEWCVKFGHTIGVYVPYSSLTAMWLRLRPTRTDKSKCCERGFSFLSQKTRESNRLQMPLQRQHSLLSYLKRPWVLVRLGLEPATSRSADRRSPNWANQAAVLAAWLARLKEWNTIFLAVVVLVSKAPNLGGGGQHPHPLPPQSPFGYGWSPLQRLWCLFRQINYFTDILVCLTDANLLIKISLRESGNSRLRFLHEFSVEL